MAQTFQTMYKYALRRLKGRSDSNAKQIAKEVVNDSVRYLAEKDYTHFRERGYINVPAPFTSGTVTVDAGATYCSLSSGGSWSSTYSGWMILIGDKKVAYEATITSNPARITFGASASWGYASQANVSYALFPYQYDLPSDFRRIGDVLDDTILGKLQWVDNLNEFETYRLQTYGTSGQMEVACIANKKLLVWPYATAQQVIPLPYYRWPVDGSADSDTVDFPDEGGQLVLLRRCIDYHAAIELGDDRKIAAAKSRLNDQETRSRKYHRGREGNIVLAPGGGQIERITKIVGSDD